MYFPIGFHVKICPPPPSPQIQIRLDFNGFYSLLILYEIVPCTFETDSTS